MMKSYIKKEERMFPKVKQVLEKLVEDFKGDKIVEAIAYTKYPRVNAPCNSWSFLNQLMVYHAETQDARGFRQWQEVNRFVKKGAKSFYILVPLFKKNEEEETLTFFKAVPVFRFEDTDGEELDYQKLELPDLPLIEVATQWGISVKAVNFDGQRFGFYKPSEDTIALLAPEEQVFFHELVHVADKKLNEDFKVKQDPIQEIVAELGSLALARLVGKKPENFGYSYRYIESYAEDLKLTPHTAVMRVLQRVDNSLNLILKNVLTKNRREVYPPAV